MSGQTLSHGDIAEMAEEYNEKKRDVDTKKDKEARETGRSIAGDLLEQEMDEFELVVVGMEIIQVAWEKAKTR